MAISVEEARAVIDAHLEAERQARRDGMLQYVGRFFRAKNFYSPDEEWPVYYRVDAITDSARGRGLSVQRDSYGQIMIHPGEWQSPDQDEEISAHEFWSSVGDLRDQALDLLRRPLP